MIFYQSNANRILLILMCLPLLLLNLWIIDIDRSISEAHADRRSKNDKTITKKRAAIEANANAEVDTVLDESTQDTKSARIDRVVNTLVSLAKMKPNELRLLLDSTNDNEHPFMLNALINGTCPWKNDEQIDWLPKRPSMSLKSSAWFKNNNSTTNNTSHRVVAYYEHLSKAGGTSICKLAMKNMPVNEVPRYYCMPSENKKRDARIGSWDAKKLLKYATQDKPTIKFVSNEWEPFNIEFLTKFHHDNEGKKSTNNTKKEIEEDNKLSLLFISSIRHPINRLLSAYKFWGILHNRAKQKPTFGLWLKRFGKRAKIWKILSGDFIGNVGRFNFATWKFSGGNLPNIGEEHIENELLEVVDDEKENGSDKIESNALLFPSNSTWEEPFRIAIRTLSQFDLLIPLEYMSSNPQPITDLLGWNNFDNIHIVTAGGVVNHDALKELSNKQYITLWNANRLDMILHSWSTAVYLARINCSY